MAKKKVTTKEEVVEEITIPVLETVSYKKIPEVAKKPTWEIKARNYALTNNDSPLSKSIRTSGVFYFDEEVGYERELRVTKNQRTPFVDEFKGTVMPESVIFRHGILHVPKEKQILQKILSVYHPHKGRLFYEVDEVEIAITHLDALEVELEAMNVAANLDIDMAEAVMRTEIGSKVSEMSSKELKRDLLLYAKRNPYLLLELVNDDNIHLRNVGIKATELSIIKLSSDNRAFLWGSNDRKLMTVPFDEHPYSALASWFKTDEGMEVLNSIEKRLN